MNSTLKLLLCRTNGKSVFGTIVRNLKVTQKCLLFDERYLGLEPLWKEQEKLKAAIIEKKEKAAFDLEDVMKFTRKNARILMAGSDSGEDIKHLVNLTEKFIKEGLFSTVELRGFILQVFRVAYSCDQIDLVLGMFDNEIIKPHVSGTFAGLIVMDKLYRKKRYDAVIELFDKQFKDYSEEKSFSEMAPWLFRQKIPYDQLSCVIAALLALNSRESFQKLKTLVDSVCQVGSSLNRRSVARAFLLSINQGDAKFALNVVHSFAFSIDLRLNLEIIALCLLNKPYQGFVLAEEMFSIRWSDSLNFQGRFFPLVFKSFEEAIERSSHQSEYLKRYNYIKEKANRLRRISPVDLEQYCSSSEK